MHLGLFVCLFYPSNLSPLQLSSTAGEEGAALTQNADPYMWVCVMSLPGQICCARGYSPCHSVIPTGRVTPRLGWTRETPLQGQWWLSVRIRTPWSSLITGARQHTKLCLLFLLLTASAVCSRLLFSLTLLFFHVFFPHVSEKSEDELAASLVSCVSSMYILKRICDGKRERERGWEISRSRSRGGQGHWGKAMGKRRKQNTGQWLQHKTQRTSEKFPGVGSANGVSMQGHA